MAEKKKSILENVVNAFTNKDEKEAAAKAAADKLAAEKRVAAQMTAAKAAAAKLAADKAAAAKLAAEKAAAAKLAAEKAAAAKIAADKASAERLALANAAAAARAAAVAAAAPKPGTVNVKSLRVRKDHSTESPVVAGLSFGDKVSVLSTWTDGKNTWANLGPDKWAAIKYDGEEMIKMG